MNLTFDLDFDRGRRSTYSECLCVTPLKMAVVTAVFTFLCAVVLQGISVLIINNLLNVFICAFLLFHNS